MKNKSTAIVKVSRIVAIPLLLTNMATAQITVDNQKMSALINHGIDQYQQGHYNLAQQTFKEYVKQQQLPAKDKAQWITDPNSSQAHYYLILTALKLNQPNAVTDANVFLNQSVNTAQRQRVAYELAKHYFNEGKDLQSAVKYYEMAGVGNLTNEEIADAKFEMAYSYFLLQDFDRAKNLLANIKEFPEHKYYMASNYYYGLLTYNEGNYDDALKSFSRVHNDPKYKDLVPYYETEIYYFKGDYNKVLRNAEHYLNRKDKLYYDKELRLLTAQTLFEQKKYKEALPYFQYYYNNSDKVRKEELYEYGYTYYQLAKYDDAIDKFQQLSDAQDSLGQISMYLLGDCYLKINDKKGARNAFGLCSEMNFNPQQQEAASFLYNKLSYELGYESIATHGLHEFISHYPTSTFNVEAKNLLSSLLVKKSNYVEAYDILSGINNKDSETQRIYQQAAVGRGLQLMQNKEYEEADEVFDQSLKQPVNPALEAVAYFWKGEIAYKLNQFDKASQFTKLFLSKVKGNETATAAISAKATVQNANVNLGYAALKSDNYAEAQTAFSDVQKTGTNNNTTSDAIIRQADAAFMQKDFDNALGLYNKAIEGNFGAPEYAKYQKALILGLQGKNNEKVALLKTVTQQNSPVQYDAMLELATEYMNSDKNKDAISLLENIASSSANATIKSKAAYQLGYAYQDNNQLDKAIDAYKKFITDYPLATERNTALNALKTIYINQGSPEKYAAYMRDQNIPEGDISDVEEAFYDAADNEFSKASYEKAIQQYTKYLDQYPNGKYTAKALYYRGESNAALKKKDAALNDYNTLLEKGWNEFSEDAALKAANIYTSQNNTAGAKKYYELLLKNNASENNTGVNLGLMKIAFSEKSYEEALGYADKLINNKDADATTQATAKLYKAKSLQAQQQTESAKSIYQELDKANVGAASAEARYRIAEILFKQKQNAAAEKAASYAAQASGGEEYWVIKNYILLADILTDNKDYFNAKATLQSIISNASDKDLIAEAKEKLTAVKSLEKNKSKLAD